jgi:spermidine synthase
MAMRKKEEWQKKHLERLSKSLGHLLNEKDGNIFDEIMPSSQEMIIEKNGNKLELFFVDPVTDEFSGAMSEIDLKHPLRLTAPYQKGMMLSLLWKENPERIYILGFGGGRIATILHHHFPQTIIESTEIDPDVLDIAKRFFGAEPDGNLRVELEEGREFLEGNRKEYDIIIIDGYSGGNQIPLHLRTREFYELCKKRLNRDGVVVVNLVDTVPQYSKGVNTLKSCFDNLYLMKYEDADIYFGSKKKLDLERVVQRAKRIQERNWFDFSILPPAKCLKPLAKQQKYLKGFRRSDGVFKD